jgi:concanavalin A-like lectin/glucanase superfamily protein
VNGFLSTASIALTQPFTYSAIAKYTNVGVDVALYASDSSNNGQARVNALAVDNKIIIYSGAFTTGDLLTSAAWQAHAHVFNSTSSIIALDGTQLTGLDCGTNNPASGSNIVFLARTGGSTPWLGQATEFGLWASAFTSGQITNMSANQHAYWGF